MSIDMVHPNRMILTEKWEEREHPSKYMEFRQTEGPEGIVAGALDNLESGTCIFMVGSSL